MLVASPALDKRAVSVDGMTKSFGPRSVFDSFSFSVEAGERVGLLGPNGCGKTTLLRCIAGSTLPDAGRVTVFGHMAGTRNAKSLVGISLAQDKSFYMRLTGRENLLLFARLRQCRDVRGEVAQIEQELDLKDVAGRRVDSCSTGMVQRLAFARALIGAPRVLLLDEASRSLDAEATENLWAALQRRRETAVIFATHLEDDLDHLSRVVSLG